MSLALLLHYLLLNMFRMLIFVHPSSGAYDLFDKLFHGLYSGSMCVGVTLPQRNTNTHRTRALQPTKQLIK